MAKGFYLKIWSGSARLLREKRVKGRPPRRKGAEEDSRDRPLKASAWSGNQHPNGTGKVKTVDPII
ncbi:hypothetical protein B8W99_23255 [Peribacillus simplex]|nr:hypothetical protein B8W99_23255 [Peribacillus simplex]